MATLIIKKDDSFLYGTNKEILQQLESRKLPSNAEILYVPDNPLSEAKWYTNLGLLKKFLRSNK